MSCSSFGDLSGARAVARRRYVDKEFHFIEEKGSLIRGRFERVLPLSLPGGLRFQTVLCWLRCFVDICRNQYS